MAVDGIDANIQSLISGAQMETQKKIDKEDQADEARKKLDKKIQIKKETLKESNVQREVFQKNNQVQQKMQQVMGGAHGQDAADGLNQWSSNKEVQQKLTEGQKQLFREAMAKNPSKAGTAGKALDNLSKQPGFQQAVKNSQQMGTLQKGLLENPKAEKGANEMLQSRFMQSKKSDGQVKNRFMDFGFKQMGKGNLKSVQKAGDMLGTLSQKGVGKGGQRAAMNMAHRAPADGKAMSNVDGFVQDPNVGKMPNFARTKATELLSKSGGKEQVREGFQKLAADPKFKAQTAQNKGRFFTTTGTGRPSEYRQITDKQLQALQNPGFPKRAGQVGKFLNKMSQQIQKGGAKGIDNAAAMKAAKSSPMPRLAIIPTSDDMDDEDKAMARKQNRANTMQFFNQLQRMYEKSEKKLNAAKYLEDVNALQNLREPDMPDLSSLSAKEQAFIEERGRSVRKTLDRVRKLQRQKARELRTKRMPPAKRRARAARRRAQGRQPKYFNPAAGRRTSATQSFLQATGTTGRQELPATPQRGTLGGRSAAMAASGTDIHSQVASALSDLGGGPMTAQKAGQVAQTIAQQVAQQVATQVTNQLMGALADGLPAEPATQTPPEAPAQRRAQQGKVDGWGIPRTFERDLGGSQNQIMKPKGAEAEGPSHDAVANEAYTGRVLVKDPTSVRDLGELFGAAWKDLNKPEMALLKNLGWNQQTWDTKDTSAAKWPVAMMTPFVNLNPVQREAVRKLGFTAYDWDQKVQAFTMGKNA